MIIVQLIGGLGNQMFQYAAGRSLALHLETELKLDITQFQKIRGITPREYSLCHFRIKENFASRQDLQCARMSSTGVRNFFVNIRCSLTGNKQISYKKEPRHFIFDRDFFRYPDNSYLEGYWQSEKYFKDIEDLIRREFTLKKELDTSNAQVAENILDSNAVSVHIRRGDYVANPAVFNYLGVCSLEYYQKAIECIAKKISDPHFYIFSDDTAWVKQNLVINYPHTHVIINQGKSDFLDLWLMSLCRHHIIANSSFSWWGAWLGTNADKITIAPSRWANIPSGDVYDIIPDGWIKIED